MRRPASLPRLDLDAFLDHSRRRRDEDTHHHAGRPSDWVDPDSTAITGRGLYRHSLHRAAQRHREGRSRRELLAAVRRACARMQAKETASVTLDDAMAYPWHHLDVDTVVAYRTLIFAMTPMQTTRNDAMSEDHLVHLSPTVTAYLQRWVGFRVTGPGVLFTALNDNRRVASPMHPASVRYMLQTRAAAAGIARPFGPHDFRRTFATELLRTHDAAVVSKLLNHNRLASTLIYDLVEDDLQREAVQSIDLQVPDLSRSPANPAPDEGPGAGEVA